jgi:quercetin dioxygenase-like cupin family protein
MAGFQEFELADLEKRQTELAKPYLEFLRRPGFSMGLYILPTGGSDPQHPHDADEVYVVLRGQASLQVDGEKHPVRGGSVRSVDRGGEHRFVDITEDLHILVMFAPPESPDD